MTSVTDNCSGALAAARSASPRFFVNILSSVAVISLLTFAYHLTNNGTLNTLSNATCIALIAYAGYLVWSSANNTRSNLVYLALASGFTLLSIAINGPNASMADAIKYLSIYVFYAAGYACASQFRWIEFWLVCILALLPFLFLATVGESRVPEFHAANPGLTFAYLPNANVGTLYFAALISTMAPGLGGAAILLQFANVLMLNKIGAALATLFAIGLWAMFPFRKQSILAIAFAALLMIVGFWIGALDRVVTVLESMQMVAVLGPHYVARMDFGRLVELTGTTDLSGFFRIIHWTNIWEIYSSGGLGTLLFGYGIGQTANLTVIPLIPHNDYLRLLAEYGLVNLAVFVCFLVHVVRSLRPAASKLLFIVLLIYFASENLIDHFASMALYFAYAGRYAALSRETVPDHHGPDY